MAGWKRLRGLSLCDPPCCEGYVERVVHPPMLQTATFCQKVAEEPEPQGIRMIPPIMRARNNVDPQMEKKYHNARLLHWLS